MSSRHIEHARAGVVRVYRRRPHRQAAKRAIAALKAWYEKIGSPTSLEAAGISSPEFEALADHAVKLGKRWGITSYTKDDVIEIYRLCAG